MTQERNRASIKRRARSTSREAPREKHLARSTSREAPREKHLARSTSREAPREKHLARSTSREAPNYVSNDDSEQPGRNGQNYKSLHTAKQQRNNDEFYTLRPTIEDELYHYGKLLKGKIVFCNCDDPEKSNFWHYLHAKFNKFKLKKLISTHYHLSDLFEKNTPAYKLEWDGRKRIETTLKGNGGFASPECVKILKEADIIITNPPWSLFRDYVPLLMKHKKKFLIIGNINSVAYKEISPLIQKNKMWLGYSKTGMRFKTPQDKLETKGYACWFTNLKHNKRDVEMILGKSYKKNPENYPKYDNYDAIEVDKVDNIPKDYEGVMGVPISFLSKHNPRQFEILGVSQRGCHDKFPDIKKYDDYWEMRQDGTRTGASGKKLNECPVLVGNNGRNNYCTNGKIEVQTKYQRIFIQNKNPEK